MTPRKKETAPQNFDQSLRELETIVKKLEDEEVALEASLELVAKGWNLIHACERQLNSAENRIRQLMEQGGGLVEQPLEGEGEDAVNDEIAREDGAPETPRPPASGDKDELPF
jgi:exodeoxyribonuclease VII small subunit